MADYSQMTSDDFDTYLHQFLAEIPAADLLDVPGVYAIVAEHYNNIVLEKWAEDNPDLAYPEDDEA